MDQEIRELNKIPVRIYFGERQKFPAKLFSHVIGVIDEAIYQVEIKELELLSKTFPEIPKVSIDAARYRLQEYRGSSVFIENVSRGSIYLECFAVGLSIWLLQQTLGETIKEAWLESESHEKIKNFLKSSLIRKSKSIGAEVNKKINKPKKADRISPPRTELTIDAPPNRVPTISINVYPEDDEPNPEDEAE